MGRGLARDERRKHRRMALGGRAVVFRALSADDEDRIHDSLLRTLIKNRMQDRSPVLIYEPRRRVRAELEAEIRSFGLPVVVVGDLMSAVKLLEDDVHAIILPDPGCRIPDPVTRLSTLPHVSVPAGWSRESLRGVLCN